MKIKLTQAAYGEWQASLFGACGIALGLGALFTTWIKPIALLFIFLGSLLHAWGMYKIHSRNR